MSYKIVEKKKLNDVVYLMDIEAPRAIYYCYNRRKRGENAAYNS